MKNVLEGTVVLDLSTGISGPFATKMLADHGARVIKVEPLEGDPIRREGYSLHKANERESGTYFLYLNTNKQSITLDLSKPEGQKVLERLVAKADIVLESFQPAESERLGITHERISKLKPEVVLTSVTPFGVTGPYRNYKASELTLQALSGFMYLAGDYGEAPLQVAMNQAQVTAGRYASVGTLAAYYHQQKTKEGQHVDVSIWESMATMPPNQFTFYTYTGVTQGRGPDTKSIMDGDFLMAQDGWISMTTGGGNSIEKWMLFFDLPELLAPEYETVPDRNKNWRELEELFKPVLAKWKRHEFMTKTMDERFVVGIVQTPEEIVNCPHLAERGTFFDINHPVVGTLRYPGPGYLINGKNILEGSKPAPLLGQHTSQVLSELGYDNEAITKLRTAKVI